MIQVLVLPEAELELRETVKFYEEKCAGLGLNFLREIESGLKAVKNLPNLWPLRKDGTRRYLVHRFPYLVVYIYKNDNIWIIAFAHCKRKPEYWRDRIRSAEKVQRDDRQTARREVEEAVGNTLAKWQKVSERAGIMHEEKR